MKYSKEDLIKELNKVKNQQSTNNVNLIVA